MLTSLHWPAALGRTPWPLPDRGTARAEAHAELSRSIYAQQRPTLIARVYEAVLRWLSHLVGNLVSVTPGGALALILLVALLAGLVVLLLIRLGPIRRTVRSDLDAGPTDRSAAEERRYAEALAANDEWADAIRSRLRAVSRELEETGVLDPRPGRTADELAVEAGRARPGVGSLLTAAARAFDEVWYGRRTATSTGYQTVAAADDALVAGVGAVR